MSEEINHQTINNPEGKKGPPAKFRKDASLDVIIKEPKSFNPIVSSRGYGDAKIYFLGGFPIGDDLRNGMALSGFQETEIERFLKPQKVPISKVYFSTFIKEKLEYSGTNPKKLGQALAKIDLNGYLDLLYDDLKHVNPNVIVPLDDVALSAIFPHINGIKKPKGRKHWVYCYRGSVLNMRDDFITRLSTFIRVVPTIGPYLLMKDEASRVFVRLDYKRIVENSSVRGPVKEYGLVWVAKTALELSRFFERGLSKHDGFVTFDIETYGGLLTCISFCFDGWEAISVPLYDTKIAQAERALMWQLCAKILSSNLPKCNQNIKYDWIILERHGFRVRNVLHDTMLKTGLLYPELPKGLDFLTSIYTPISYYKDEGKEFDPRLHSRDRLYLYNAKDSLAAHLVSKEQDKELKEKDGKLHNLYYNEVAPLILIYKNIDETGILVDNEQKNRLLFKYTSLYSSNLSILQGLVGNSAFNARSPQQVARLLYDELRFPKRTKIDDNGNKVYKTDKETLDDLLINHGENNKLGVLGYKIISRIILCRKVSKVIEYIETPCHPNATFRGASNLAGTETGRSSFSKTIDEHFITEQFLLNNPKTTRTIKKSHRLGRSLQTITKHGFKIDDEVFDDFEDSKIAHDLRSMFVPHHNFIFVECDGKGAEARVVCVLAEDYEELARMDQKPSVHCKFAGQIFNIDPNLVTKETPFVPKIGIAYYDLAKRLKHGTAYDLTEFRLAQMTHMPLAECKLLLDKAHENVPKMRSVYHYEVDQCILKTRQLVTPFGRQRTFYGSLNVHAFKEAKAQIPQSTISDLTKFTLHRVTGEMSGYMEKYAFLTEQHDGVLAEVHKDNWEEYAQTYKKHAERPIDFRVGSLIRDFDLVVPVEVSTSENNWMDLKEVHI